MDMETGNTSADADRYYEWTPRPPPCIVTSPACPSTFVAPVLVLGEHKVDGLATDQE